MSHYVVSLNLIKTNDTNEKKKMLVMNYDIELLSVVLVLVVVTVIIFSVPKLIESLPTKTLSVLVYTTHHNITTRTDFLTLKISWNLTLGSYVPAQGCLAVAIWMITHPMLHTSHFLP